MTRQSQRPSLNEKLEIYRATSARYHEWMRGIWLSNAEARLTNPTSPPPPWSGPYRSRTTHPRSFHLGQ